VQHVLRRAHRRRFQATEQRVEPRELRHALLLEDAPSGGRQRDLPRTPVVRRLVQLDDAGFDGGQRVLAGGLPRDAEQPPEVRERRRAAAALDGAQHACAWLEVDGWFAGDTPRAFDGLGRQQDLVQECRGRDVLAAE
jgi:hypothetical protein